MIAVIVFVVFLIVAAGVFAAASLLDERRSQSRIMKERLQAVEQAVTRLPSEELALLKNELLSEIPAINRLLSRSQRITDLQKFLSQADIQTRAGKFLLISMVAGFVLGLITFVETRVLIFSAIGLAAGCSLPFTYAAIRRSRRFHKFEELFPEAIDLQARAVRAGHAFTTALEMIANEVAEPVGGEFRKLFEEQKFGLPIRDALLNFAERMPLVDVKFFVTAVMLQRETGGNLAEILDGLSYVIRQRFKILRQVRVYTAQGRLTMMILMGLPPALLIGMAALNPEFLNPLWHDPMGHVLLAVGIVLQTIGFFLIRKIINIQV